MSLNSATQPTPSSATGPATNSPAGSAAASSTARKRTLAGLAAIAGILLLAAVLRLWRIDSLPPGFHFDESFEGLEAWRILTDPGYRPVFLTGNFGVPPLNAYANAVTFGLVRLFGGEVGPTAMRVTAAVLGVAGVAAVYGLAGELRRLDPRRLTVALPLLAAALLATLRWHIHFSRFGIEPIFVPVLWAAANWLLLRGWRLRAGWGAWASYIGCGVVLAACMYAYHGAWIVPILMLPVVAHLWLHGRSAANAAQPAAQGAVAGQLPARKWWADLRGPLVAAGVALVLVLPLLGFFAQNRDLVFLRPTQLAVVSKATNTAGNAGAGSHPGAVGPVQSALASALMFVPLPDTGDQDPRRNIPGEAALNWWQFMPFAAGLALALWRIRNPAYSLLLIGLVGLLLPGVFSEYAPHFHRVLGAAAPTALLAGLGLDALVRWGMARTGAGQPGQAKPWWRNWGVWAAVLILAGGAVTAARDYFVRWAALPDLFYAFDAGLWQIGREIAAQPPGASVYLSPTAADHATLEFAWATRPGGHGAPVGYDGRSIFPMTQGANGQPERYYVIEHEDFRTRLLLPEVLPQAKVVETIRDGAGQVYANVYERGAGEMPRRPPQQALSTALGDGITLGGYDVQPAVLKPGAVLYLQLHWLVDHAPQQEWTVFVHLLRQDAAGQWVQVAGQDGPPGGGSLPTTRWQPGWRVLDEHQVALPADLPPGKYTLAVGLYRPDGQRMPAEGQGVLLKEVSIE